MGDALCMLMIPPPMDEPPCQAPERASSFRHLTHGAFGLRRFSRSLSGGSSGDAASDPHYRHHRRSATALSTPSGTLHVRIVPSIENPSRSLIFDIFDRDLAPAVYIKIGRFTDRSPSPTRMSFKTKVVSRSHCELWMEHGKVK